MSNQNEALAIAPRTDIVDLDPTETKRKLAAISQFQAIIRHELKDGLDYGIIPGTSKPTLLKPGAEKLAKLLNCFDEYEIVERIEDWEKPLFRYLIRCTLSDMAAGTKISSGMGECNSYESKYRFRWIEEVNLPFGIDKNTLKTRDSRKTLFEFDFALEKREMLGKYGKPKEYWEAFDKAIKDGTARRVEKETKSKKKYFGHEMEIGAKQYQVPNPDIFDQVNTILKMAKKRALVDAALSAGRLSDLFTQDLDDLVEQEEQHQVTTTAPAAGSKPEEKNDGDPGPGFPSEQNPDPAEDKKATEDQLKAISGHIVELRKLGKDDGTIFPEIYRKAQEKGPQIVELQELTFAQADHVALYLGGWVEYIKTERAKKAKPSGKAA